MYMHTLCMFSGCRRSAPAGAPTPTKTATSRTGASSPSETYIQNVCTYIRSVYFPAVDCRLSTVDCRLSLILDRDRDLQIVPLGKPDSGAKIRRQSPALDDAELALRPGGPLGEHAVEVLGRDLVRRRCGEQEPARVEHRQRGGDEVAVVLHGGEHLAPPGGAERGRVEDDDVEAPLPLRHLGQDLERVADDVLGLLRIEPVEAEIAAGAGVRLGGHVDRGDRGGPAVLRPHADRAGVREQVQHAPAVGPLPDGLSPLAQ